MTFQRGFFCDDESLRYPYRSSTVNMGMLVSGVVLIPLILMLVIEWWRLKSQDSGVKSSKICGRNCHPLIGALRETYGLFNLGMLCSFFINILIKTSVGRLRPHFIEVCQPDWSQIECYTSDGRPNYVDPIPCTTDEDKWRFRNSRLSFPSGHACTSAFAAVYLVIYLHVRLRMRYSTVLRVVLQVVLLTMALYSGISRIHDYKHHWEDVLAGFVEGTIEAVLWANYVTNLSGPKKRLMAVPQDQEEQNGRDADEHLMEKV